MITRQEYEEMKFNLEEKQCQIDGQAFTIEALQENIRVLERKLGKVSQYFSDHLEKKDKVILNYILGEE